jgi:Ca2+-dependent lipid-binding protein
MSPPDWIKKTNQKTHSKTPLSKNTTEMKTVILEIKKAKNLTVSDINGFSDPYIEVLAHEDNSVVQHFKTRVVHKNLNPKFEETFKITKLKVKKLFHINIKFGSTTSQVKLVVKSKNLFKDTTLGYFFSLKN